MAQLKNVENSARVPAKQFTMRQWWLSFILASSACFQFTYAVKEQTENHSVKKSPTSFVLTSAVNYSSHPVTIGFTRGQAYRKQFSEVAGKK
jgi:hypothetical protein